jgi:hypothetical protein
LRKQQAIVDCLAIPQVNDEGDRVDWYSPVEGRVSSWKAADEDARFRALRYLENTLASVESLSKNASSRLKRHSNFWFPAGKSVSVPGENFLFLVDGKPVITFWGFVNLNENAATMCSNACVNRYSGACSRYRARTRACQNRLPRSR